MEPGFDAVAIEMRRKDRPSACGRCLEPCMHIAHAEKNEAERCGPYAEGFADDAKNSDQKHECSPYCRHKPPRRQKRLSRVVDVVGARR